MITDLRAEDHAPLKWAGRMDSRVLKRWHLAVVRREQTHIETQIPGLDCSDSKRFTRGVV
jgi:hypothetical protein